MTTSESQLGVSNGDDHHTSSESQLGLPHQHPPPFIAIRVEMEVNTMTDNVSPSNSSLRFLAINLVLEILSAVLDQLSSPSRPWYCLSGTIVSLLAAIICIAELAHRGLRDRVVLKRSAWSCKFISTWWFYYPSQPPELFGSFSDIYGLVCAVSQFVFSAVKFSYLIRHDDDPVKLSILPVIFLACVAGSKLITTVHQPTPPETVD